MNRGLMIFISSLILFSSCTKQETNPFLSEWDTPFGTPPFEKIELEHYLPGYEAGFKQQNDNIAAIIGNPEAATFENTIVALDHSKDLLNKVSRVFNAIEGSMSNEEVQKISRKISPMITKQKDDINLNEDLFKRVKEVYDQKENLGLNREQEKLLEKYYKAFIRGGINLSPDKKEEFRKINERIALLNLEFGENVLKETNRFELVIENEADLEGLTESAIKGASDAAEEKGYKGKWLFTIHKPSMIPFLQYSEKRDLREKIYKAYFTKGDNNDSLDNKELLAEVVNLRIRRAKLLGYKNHSEYVLEEQMAQNPDNVYDLLEKLWDPALKRAIAERDDMQNLIDKEGKDFKLKPWDWWYYAEKLKKVKYDLDESELRPYFQVENVIEGVFGLATDLWGIKFEERNDISKYHPDVRVFEVKEEDGKHIGILYIDYFPRASKRSGAWMDEFRRQHRRNGEMVTPIIYNVGNFSKPAGDKPALLSIDDVNTLFHEFGHALHGLLSNCTYETVAATETPRDFVEFPSQVMENWCLHPEVLKKYARHYETGEIIPDELIEKIDNSSLFNQGFGTVEYLAAALLDMDYHTLTEEQEIDINEFENSALKKRGLIPEIIPRYRSTYFLHITSHDYSSGYYSYIWSEVLDADAFDAFVESGDVYNSELAQRFRKYILASGGSDDSMKLYNEFRGQDPSIEPLLVKRGLVN